jgi:hypothetical protein
MGVTVTTAMPKDSSFSGRCGTDVLCTRFIVQAAVGFQQLLKGGLLKTVGTEAVLGGPYTAPSPSSQEEGGNKRLLSSSKASGPRHMIL